MSAFDGMARLAEAREFLSAMRKRGVNLWVGDGKLRYRAMKGALRPEDLNVLRTSRDLLILLLRDDQGSERLGFGAGRGEVTHVPLAYSQLAHWNLFRLWVQPSMRQVTVAKRILGRLKLDALRASLDAMVLRHEALRTQIILLDGVPMQEISGSGSYDLQYEDLTGVGSCPRDSEIARRIQEFITTPVDVAKDPLLGARILKTQEDAHILILGMEHMVSDGFSMGVLVRDMVSAYVRIVRERPIDLPPVPTQFSDYAIRQVKALRSWQDSHGEYWERKLAGCGRLRFPRDVASECAGGERGCAPIRIDPALRTRLAEWCRSRRTTLVLGVLAAYAALVLRWCGANDVVIQYQFDGRVDPSLNRTVGYISSVLYLRVSHQESDRFIDLLGRITEEYCQAYEHADRSYFASRLPRPEFTRNTSFNWLPQGSLEADLSELEGSADALSCAPVRFSYPTPRDIDREPFILMSDTGDEVLADIYFPLDSFSMTSMRTFGRNFLGILEVLVTRPDSRVADVGIVR